MANHFDDILTSEHMLYYVTPVQIELYGMQLGDTSYITEFLNNFAGKVRQRYATEEIINNLLGEDDLEELRKLLAVEEYFKGAYEIQTGYQFLLSDVGFYHCFGVLMGESEGGKLEVTLQNGKVTNAWLIKYRYNEIGDTEILYQRDLDRR